ncbi:MAG: glycosyltransferase family 2 protein [Nitrospirae bacterium]|nr:glycosyltransferase family 2 protein [Nitrospirota bacterium]
MSDARGFEMVIVSGERAKGRRVSVALCTYNGARYLKDQLDSIAAQTLPPHELVICDDRSTDDTAAIVQAFASHAPFPVRFSVNHANLGSTKNFEQAIQRCEGDLIALSDQDDVWRPRKLERMVSAFAASPEVGAVFSDGEVVDDRLRPLGYGLWEAAGFGPRRRERFEHGQAVEVLLKNNVVTGATLAFRRDFLKAILPIPAAWVHDSWIALLITAIGRVAIIDEPLVLYRHHSRQQIGVTRRAGSSGLAWVRSSLADVLMNINGYVVKGDEEYSMYADQYRLACERLAATLDPSDRGILSRCRAKADHFQARADMSHRRWMRFPMVMHELLGLRYHRYSSGYKSLARDLVRAVLFWTGSTRRASQVGMP